MGIKWRLLLFFYTRFRQNKINFYITFTGFEPLEIKETWNIILTIEEITSISEKIIVNKENKYWYSKEEFDWIKNSVISAISSNFKRKWKIDSIYNLSINICNRIDRYIKNSKIIEENRHQIKTEIVLILFPTKIDDFIQFLKKFKITWNWSIDSILKDNKLNKEDKVKFKTMVNFLRKNIKNYSKVHKRWKVDWIKIMNFLIEKWEHELANNFTKNRKNVLKNK
jgi:hypothetical protein